METFHIYTTWTQFRVSSSHSLGKQLEWKHFNSTTTIDGGVELPTRWENNLNGNSKETNARTTALADTSHSLGKQLEWKQDERLNCEADPFGLPTRWENNLNGNSLN